jgi:hypothetical protein
MSKSGQEVEIGKLETGNWKLEMGNENGESSGLGL